MVECDLACSSAAAALFRKVPKSGKIKGWADERFQNGSAVNRFDRVETDGRAPRVRRRRLSPVEITSGMEAARVLAESVVGPKPKIEEEIEAVLGDNQVAKAVENVAEAVLDAPVVTEGGVEVRGEEGGGGGADGVPRGVHAWCRAAMAMAQPPSKAHAFANPPPSTRPKLPPASCHRRRRSA